MPTRLKGCSAASGENGETGAGRSGTDRKRRKPRLADVAKLAGVGIATVDRVLNERGHVSADKVRKVLDAAAELELPRILPPPYRRGLRVEVLIARRESEFIWRLGAAFRRVAGTLDRSIIVVQNYVNEERPDEVAKRIRSSQSDALVVFGKEEAGVIESVAAKTSAGVPVVTLVSDLPTTPRAAYVGIDHYRAGRTAAFFMAGMAEKPGSVIVVCHSFDYRAHASRVSGYREGLDDDNSRLELACIHQSRDRQFETEEMISEWLAADDRQIVGIYNTGGANRAIGRAIGRAIEMGHINRKPLFIGHELTVHTSRMLTDRTMTLVIDQNPDLQASRALDFLLQHFGYVGKCETPDRVRSPSTVRRTSSPLLPLLRCTSGVQIRRRAAISV
ncbi:MAG: LacI family transcriptional regulator [Hyphomicrobiales bacterium]|nr:LacI family transcriptional regulator [Hyphomicrobiales bacterium]